ncbi:MAG TPA: hypothetical protein VFT55_08200, partial [Planctomycetota bacterium]|nr:hypothetical protein [Planctomycetota bacterium]
MRWLAALLGVCLVGGLAASWLAWGGSDVGPPPPAADPVGVPTAESAAAAETAEDMPPDTEGEATAGEDAVEAPAERVDAEPPV